ncbi:MAG: glycosyltransferase [Gemmatimonadota bacterium]
MREDHDEAAPRTALFLAYHYPPVRSAGVERTARFVRYLPELGYRVRVLTTSTFGGRLDGHTLRAWEPLSWYRWWRTPAARTDASSPARSPRRGRLARVARRWLLVPDGQVTWLPAAAVLALRQIRQDPPDLIYSTSPPASAHLLGLLLKGLTGLPWVADFRDTWVDDPLDPVLLEMPCRRRLERRMEGAVMAAADAVVVATGVSADYLAAAHPEARERLRIIPNGFDPEEVAEPDAERLTPEGLLVARDEDLPAVGGARAGAVASACPEPGVLRLVHTGSFSYSHPRRSPEALFAAVRRLLEGDPEWRYRLELLLAGRLAPAEIGAAQDLVEAGVVELCGELDRAAALALQRQADVLVVVDHARDGPASNLPGKVFEYLATGRPVLALCGPGALRDLLTRTGGGIAVAPGEVPAIADRLADLWQQKADSRLPAGARAEALAAYHRRHQAGELAACFDQVVGRARAGGAPGPVTP